MLRRLILPTLCVMGLAAGVRAAGVFYDASTNLLPAPPSFFRFDFDTPIVGPIFGFNAAQSIAGGVYQMGPTDQSKYTFWYTNVTVLDHTQVVEVSARLQLVSQTSANPADRAGLALSFTDDQNLYNELYLNSTEIFINKRVADTRVRDVAFSMDTTSAFHDYTMRLQSGVLTVLVDGTPRLTGALFDANGLNLPTLPNWAVVGDITSSALGTWQMQTFSVSVVPEPSLAVVALGGALAHLACARRRFIFR
jgi:hypothetical protein